MMGKFSCVFMRFLLIFLAKFASAELDLFSNIFDKNGHLYYPTIHAESEKCRNVSLFYLQNLKAGTLWATEMYDATGKLQSGILHGSAYSLGNFDQCIETKVPLEGNAEFSGKYCLAKYAIKLRKKPNITSYHNVNFEEDDYRKYHNISVREKVMAYTQVGLRTPRTELYSAFCIPSVCLREDLDLSLKRVISNNNNKNKDIDVQAEVEKRSCQVKEDFFHFDNGDTMFLLFIAISGAIIVIASTYHLLTKLEALKKHKLDGKHDAIIRCFSLPANLKKLLKTKTNDRDGLDSIAGLKVFSMFLIIMGHRCMFIVGSPIINARFIEQIYRTPDATILLNGPIIVDTFFIISGFLATFLLLNKLTDSKDLISKLPLIYLHRLVRLVPVYAVVVAFYCTLFAKIGSGPLWYERIGLEQERCKENWWANMLFINNYVNVDQICMFQSWFIDCDLHFFLITPLIVWLLWKRPKLGFYTLVGLIVASIFLVFAIVYINSYDPILLLYIKLLRDPVLNTTFQKVYIPSHMRATPYLIGILIGYLRYKIKVSDYKIPRYLVYCCWPVLTFMAFATIYAAFVFYIPDIEQNTVFAAFYACMHHLTWSLCIGWAIIAMSTGNGSWFEKILGWKPLICLNRITYPAFLIHGAVQIYTSATIRTPAYASVFNLIYQSAGDIALAYTLGCILSLLYEAPMIQLENIILGKGNHKTDHLQTSSGGAIKKELECNEVVSCEPTSLGPSTVTNVT